MVFPEDILIRAVLFALGLFGFWVGRHIYIHKRSVERPLMCMVGFDCDSVVHSDYSKFFGIHVEVLGMLYYGLVTLFYFSILFIPNILHSILVGFMFLLSSFAFLFSAYLIGIQLLVIKKWCSWCIVSAFVSTCIFALTVVSYNIVDVLQLFMK